MRLAAILTISCLTLFSCNKKQDKPLVKTFTGDLPIVQTNTPATALAGQHIRANVRCGLTYMSGSLHFEGFDIKETSPRIFSIAAKALYKDWRSDIALQVMMQFDTVATITTTTTGTYVLQFYNDKKLFKSDTVQVN
jgi:hypothetical protein